MKKIVYSAFIPISLLFLGIFLWDNSVRARTIMTASARYGREVFNKGTRIAKKMIGSEQIFIIERSYSPEQVIENLKYKNQDLYLEQCFFPYVLLKARYQKEVPSRSGDYEILEGVLLWSLVNGEVVLDTETWNCSQGFRECLISKADRHDMLIMQTLISMGGSMNREQLIERLASKNFHVAKSIKSCHRKKLIFVQGDRVGIPFRKFQPLTNCMTTMNRSLVSLMKPKGSIMIAEKHSEDDIRSLASKVFGKNFYVIDTKKVFVPAYRITTKGTDGSQRTEFINAINGRKLDS
ncbi:hypothetical protein [Chlamydiifrater volucris]|uniref:hypothetical protein n=1 Tax=Chlamydiifrater volucris TaxID=2681470 RepID=UPI001BD194DC|nr:hypothetical protein [Chlamydiifrater volucris]